MKMFLKYIAITIFVVLIFSCGKYGYNFQDGWQNGDSDGISPEDSSLTYIDISKIDKARIFPGLIGENVKRAQDTSITLNIDYREVTSADLKVWKAPLPIFSVGLYAPAGENIKIVVPEGVNGLSVQIGPHSLNLGNQSVQYRDGVITTYKALFPGTNYVRNPYGGLIWIKSTISHKNPAILKFSNVVRTSDFVLGKSNEQDWLKDVEANDVPWLELRSNRVVFTVPRAMVLQYKSELKITESLNKWAKLYEEDVYKWMGLTINNPNKINSFPELPERAILDIQVPHPEYVYAEVPWVAYMDKFWFNQMTNANELLTDSIASAWPMYHVVGHNYQMWDGWNWGALHQTTSNLFVFKAADRLGISQNTIRDEVKRIILNSLNFATKKTKKNFNDGYNDGEDGYHRLAPFLQIFEKVKGKNNESGWDFFTKLFYSARNSNYYFGFDEAKMDYFYRELCDFTGVDYASFMDAWGIKISLSARKEMRTKFPPLTKAIWTYNPITNTGGDEDVIIEYDLHAPDFVWSSNMLTASNESIGNFKALSDGSSSTYWHTCWDNCARQTTSSAEAPTYLELDMQELKTISGVYLQNRQGNTYRRGAVVYTRDSQNGNWTRQGELVLAEKIDDPTRDGRKEFKFPDIIQARYIRFAFTERNYHNDVHTAIAEAGVFYKSK